MTDTTEATSHPGSGPPPEARLFARPAPVIVADHGNSRMVTAYLADVDHRRRVDPNWQRIVVRPTPGATERAGLGLDLLAALGKNTEYLRQDKVSADSWDLAAAWLSQAGVTDVFLDRAHTLPVQRIKEMLDLAIALRASLWLIWSGDESIQAVQLLIAATEAQSRRGRWYTWGDGVIGAGDLPCALPLPPGTARRDLDRILRRGPSAMGASGETWPVLSTVLPTVLPTVDFPLFRAACRRHLGPGAFAAVDAVYRQAAERVDAWMEERIEERSARANPASLTGRGRAELIAWLRDSQLGPATTPALALSTLRATQAALLRHAVLLRWDPAALGADPQQRLCGDLHADRNGVRVRALHALGRTEHAAATAISLHLNEPPTWFGCWRLCDADADADASTLTGRPHRHQLKNYETDAGAGDPCTTTIQLPELARTLVQAHLLYRRLQGAADDDPLFINSRDPALPVAAALRARITATCKRLNLTPAWLHGHSCKHGGDIGLNPRTFGWLHERGLSLHQLSTTGLADFVTTSAPPRIWPGPPPAAPIDFTRPDSAGPSALAQRLFDSGLSRWELGDLLGLHPHELTTQGAGQRSAMNDQPVRVVAELARRLDMHPADLADALEPVLTNQRTNAPPTRSTADRDNADAVDDAADAERDVQVLLTALATISVPLTADELAAALTWTLDRTGSALRHAQQHPHLAGPVALRRVAPQRWTITARHDVLSRAQRANLNEAAGYRSPLTAEEATALLATYTCGGTPSYSTWRQEHPADESTLKAHGLIHQPHGPQHAAVSPDVRYGLDRQPDYA